MPLVEISGLTKQYEGVQALADASLAIREGEVHGLVGANGAGKSTLIKIVCGLVSADGGELLWDGEPGVRGRSGSGGIGLVMQDSQLCESMTVAENIGLGHYPSRLGLLRRLDRRALRRDVSALLEQLAIPIDPASPVATLRLATRRMVEVAKAVAREPRLLILDEPTAALGVSETEALLDLMKRLRERGVAVLFVTHRLPEVLEVCDRATVLRDGATVATVEGGALSIARLVSLMTGQEPIVGEPPEPAKGTVRLRAAGLSGETFRDVDLSLPGGQTTVITGLVGSGRSSLLRGLAGLTRSYGRLEVDGSPLERISPRSAARRGVRFVPETRGDGLIEHLSVLDNLLLPLLPSGAVSRWGFVSKRRLRRFAQGLTERFDIKTADVRTPIWQLSGGNQRKAMLAACFGAEPSVMLIDEPTEGVDVGAKADIHRLLHQFCAAGGAVGTVMSESDECLEAGHRFVVMRAGEVVGSIGRRDATKGLLTEMAFGQDPQEGAPA